MTRHVLVRADGNGRIGLGHIMRTLSVADELKRTGAYVTFLCRALPTWAETQVRERGFGLLELKCAEKAAQEEDAAETVKALEEAGADTVLLDHYGLTEVWTNHVRTNARPFIVAFDDLAADARDVDILIDSGPGRRALDYEHLIPPDALCLPGPEYAPLRPEFAMVRAGQSRTQQGPCQVAISLGGVDPTNATSICLDALDTWADVEATVILSSAAPHLDTVRERVASMGVQTRLLLDRTDMANVLKDMDIVIGAGGTSALERCALGLPSVLVLLADNQKYNAANLVKAGAAALAPEISASAINDTLGALVQDTDLRANMGRAAASLCDGRGAPRVAAAMLAAQSGITLRPVSMDDMSLIYGWQCEPGTRRFSRNPNVPELEEHKSWFEKRLPKVTQDPFYIVMSGNEACGFVRLDSGSAQDAWEVSIVIGQSGQSRGLGRTALGLLRLMHPERKIEAVVHSENKASQRLFESAGYRRMAADRFVSDGWQEIVERQRHDN